MMQGNAEDDFERMRGILHRADRGVVVLHQLARQPVLVLITPHCEQKKKEQSVWKIRHEEWEISRPKQADSGRLL